MAWIDDWLPQWQFEEVHHIRSSAAPGALLDAAAAYDPAHDAWINAALSLREAPARLGARLGGRSALAQRPRFGLADFVRLGRDGDAALAYGLAGRFWEPGYGLQPLADASAWQAHAQADAAKLVLGFEAQRSQHHADHPHPGFLQQRGGTPAPGRLLAADPPGERPDPPPHPGRHPTRGRALTRGV